MQRTVAALLLLVGPGCATRKESQPATSTGSDAAAPTAAAALAAVTARFSCDQLLPAAALAQRLSGATLEAEPEAPANAVACGLRRGGASIASLIVTCHPRMPASRETSLGSLRKHLRAIDLPGLGAGAVSLETGGQRSVSAWDDDSDCQVTLTAPADADDLDLVALAKDVLAALPPR
jgi:hypothetical protein